MRCGLIRLGTVRCSEVWSGEVFGVAAGCVVCCDVVHVEWCDILCSVV